LHDFFFFPRSRFDNIDGFFPNAFLSYSYVFCRVLLEASTRTEKDPRDGARCFFWVVFLCFPFFCFFFFSKRPLKKGFRENRSPSEVHIPSASRNLLSLLRLETLSRLTNHSGLPPIIEVFLSVQGRLSPHRSTSSFFNWKLRDVCSLGFPSPRAASFFPALASFLIMSFPSLMVGDFFFDSLDDLSRR